MQPVAAFNGSEMAILNNLDELTCLELNGKSEETQPLITKLQVNKTCIHGLNVSKVISTVGALNVQCVMNGWKSPKSYQSIVVLAYAVHKYLLPGKCNGFPVWTSRLFKTGISLCEQERVRVFDGNQMSK